jgi:hypothetical protein
MDIVKAQKLLLTSNILDNVRNKQVQYKKEAKGKEPTYSAKRGGIIILGIVTGIALEAQKFIVKKTGSEISYQKFNILIPNVNQEHLLKQGLVKNNTIVIDTTAPERPKPEDKKDIEFGYAKTFKFYPNVSYSFSGKADVVSKLEPGYLVEVHCVDAKAVYSDLDKNENETVSKNKKHMTFLGCGAVDRINADPSTGYKVLMSYGKAFNTWINPFEITNEQINNEYEYRDKGFVRLELDPKTVIGVHYNDTKETIYASCAYPAFDKDSKHWIYEKVKGSKEKFTSANFTITMEQSKYNSTSNQIDFDNPEKTFLYISSYTPALRIFKIHDQTKWVELAYYIMSQLNCLMAYELNVTRTFDMDEKKDSRKLTTLFFLADIADLYNRIGIPLLEKDIKFKENSIPIPNEDTIINIESTTYNTSSLIGKKNVKYRAILNVENMLEYEEFLKPLSPDDGSRLFKIIQNPLEVKKIKEKEKKKEVLDEIENFIVRFPIPGVLVYEIFAIIDVVEEEKAYKKVCDLFGCSTPPTSDNNSSPRITDVTNAPSDSSKQGTDLQNATDNNHSNQGIDLQNAMGKRPSEDDPLAKKKLKAEKKLKADEG